MPAAFSDATRGMIYGTIGMLCFSLTPVATRAALHAGMDPMLVGGARPFGAALLGALALLLTRQSWPRLADWVSIAIVSAGLCVGFPLMSAWAMVSVPATHVAAIFGLLPLAMALTGALRAGDRPSWLFWLSGVIGSAIVVTFAWHGHGGRLEPADWLLFATVVLMAISYTEGALLSRRLGGWQVISWALVLALPISGTVLAAALCRTNAAHLRSVSMGGWEGLAYVTVVSQWLGLFPWYRGLALGGVARVGQLNLIMPFVTILAAAVLLGERLTLATILTALAVLATVVVGRCAPVRKAVTLEPTASR